MTLECGWRCRGQSGNHFGNARGCRDCYTADRVRGFVLSLATVDFGSNSPAVTIPYVLVSHWEVARRGHEDCTRATRNAIGSRPVSFSLTRLKSERPVESRRPESALAIFKNTSSFFGRPSSPEDLSSTPR